MSTVEASKSLDVNEFTDSLTPGLRGSYSWSRGDEEAGNITWATTRHADQDVSYPTWRDIGFALADEFSTHTAPSIFENWSRGGSKWDADAERQAKRIVEDATDGGRTISTVVYHAKQGGWDASAAARKNSSSAATASDGGAAASTPDTPSPAPNGDSGVNWEHVRGQYAEEGKQVGRYYAAQALEERTAWMHILEEERLWIYDDSSGTFGPWGKQEAAKMLERGLGEFYSRSEKGEVIDRLMSRNQTRREEINGGSTPSPLVCVGNGVVDLEIGEIEDHSPEHKFTRGLKWDYKPETAGTEPILEFLDDITTREADRDTIIDHLAHGLMPGHPYRAFVMMYGPGGNGKTQLGQLLRGFVGSENAASVELSDLTGGDDFRPVRFQGSSSTLATTLV